MAGPLNAVRLGLPPAAVTVGGNIPQPMSTAGPQNVPHGFPGKVCMLFFHLMPYDFSFDNSFIYRKLSTYFTSVVISSLFL
jgi:hypothetical protein